MWRHKHHHLDPVWSFRLSFSFQGISLFLEGEQVLTIPWKVKGEGKWESYLCCCQNGWAKPTASTLKNSAPGLSWTWHTRPGGRADYLKHAQPLLVTPRLSKELWMSCWVYLRHPASVIHDRRLGRLMLSKHATLLCWLLFQPCICPAVKWNVTRGNVHASRAEARAPVHHFKNWTYPLDLCHHTFSFILTAYFMQ